MSIDFLWLGGGRVRCGFFANGGLINVHEFNHANVTTSVYMSSPNLPVRTMIQCLTESVNNSASLESICTSVVSEGGYDPKGLFFTADRSSDLLTGVDSSALYPLVSIRLKSGSLSAAIIPSLIDVLTTTNNANFRWALILNPVINGVDNASWVPVTSSSVEYDVSRTTTNSLSGGVIIRSGYGSTQSQIGDVLVNSAYALGAEIDGTRDQFILAVQGIGAGSNSFVGGISWRELIA